MGVEKLNMCIRGLLYCLRLCVVLSTRILNVEHNLRHPFKCFRNNIRDVVKQVIPQRLPIRHRLNLQPCRVNPYLHTRQLPIQPRNCVSSERPSRRHITQRKREDITPFLRPIWVADSQPIRLRNSMYTTRARVQREKRRTWEGFVVFVAGPVHDGGDKLIAPVFLFVKLLPSDHQLATQPRRCDARVCPLQVVVDGFVQMAWWTCERAFYLFLYIGGYNRFNSVDDERYCSALRDIEEQISLQFVGLGSVLVAKHAPEEHRDDGRVLYDVAGVGTVVGTDHLAKIAVVVGFEIAPEFFLDDV